MSKIRHISLFTGIGGFELAAQRVWGDDYEPVLFCEMDEFCQKVLNKHWANVPIIGDVRDVKVNTNTRLLGQTEHEKQATRFEQYGESWKSGRCDLLTGGFPCQPFSQAGKRDGRSDNRHLWPEMLRVIQELQPTWVVAENVRGILSIEDGLVFEQVCVDLENAGYTVQPFVIPAVACDAYHRRDRIWFIARNITDTKGSESRESPQRKRREDTSGGSGDNGGSSDKGRKATTDTIGKRGRSGKAGSKDAEDAWQLRGSEGEDRRGTLRWQPEPELGRVAHGIPCRVDRLKALGNAIVPQVAEQIFRAIKETT